MVTSEVYDIAPHLSGVKALLAQNIDVWLTDFGPPEKTDGGLTRTLDAHILAVARAIDIITRETGKGPHLLGYSQGGLFCYQAAALRKSKDVRSIITFGSPVDIRQNLPFNVTADAAERVLAFVRTALAKPIGALESLPGEVTSAGFKLVSIRKELKQFKELISNLPDREALLEGESSRRYLGGEGFIAWPGPAFRQFVEEFVVHNRMAQGGFSVDGTLATLADVTCPILYFHGSRDEFARSPSVRAIETAAPEATCYGVEVPSGHFGLVVGGRANAVSWPTTNGFIQHLDLGKDLPSNVVRRPPVQTGSEPSVITTNAKEPRTWLGRIKQKGRTIANDLGQLVDTVRHQAPMFDRLRRLRPNDVISVGQLLSDQSRLHPESTFFLWEGRAFTYAEVDARVNAVTKACWSIGLKPGDKVAVWMDSRPSLLALIVALNRLGAVTHLFQSNVSANELSEIVRSGNFAAMVSDPKRAPLTTALDLPHTVLRCRLGGAHQEDTDGVQNLERIDVAAIELPAGTPVNQGRACDSAFVFYSKNHSPELRASYISNQRWAVSALGTAAGISLTPHDTVFSSHSFSHPSGFLVAISGALAGGSRIALMNEQHEQHAFEIISLTGASVVMYAGRELSALLPPKGSLAERSAKIRAFAGSGLSRSLWKDLTERYPHTDFIEFYASTEGTAVLVNTDRDSIGALGKPLPGSSPLAVFGWDVNKGSLERDSRGQCVRLGPNQIGVLMSQLSHGPMRSSSAQHTAQRVVQNAVQTGDRWYRSSDLMYRDTDGRYWLVGRVDEVALMGDQLVSLRSVEDFCTDALGKIECVAFFSSTEGAAFRSVTLLVRSDHTLTEAVLESLLDFGRLGDGQFFTPPTEVLQVERLPQTWGHNVARSKLANLWNDAALGKRTSALSAETGECVVYFRLDPDRPRYAVVR